MRQLQAPPAAFQLCVRRCIPMPALPARRAAQPGAAVPARAALQSTAGLRQLQPGWPRRLPAQPKTMEEPPPGGASTREEGLSVRKLLREGEDEQGA